MVRVVQKRKARGPWKYAVLAVFSLLVAAASVIALYFINLYWYPPELHFTGADIARAVIIRTSLGNITVALDGRSEFARAQFTRLARSGFYDRTKIHRIVPNLLIEGGDPLTRHPEERYLWGQGGLGTSFKNETFPGENMREGTVAFTGSKAGTYGSQFFIATKDTPWMAGKHTILGHVTSGMEIVHAIEKRPVSATGMPTDDIVVYSVQTL